jgi:hypothetical protein
VPIYVEHVCALREFSPSFPGDVGLNDSSEYVPGICPPKTMLRDYNILINQSQSFQEREQMNKCYNSGRHLSTCDKGV